MLPGQLGIADHGEGSDAGSENGHDCSIVGSLCNETKRVFKLGLRMLKTDCLPRLFFGEKT
jgi:hypothetical protein